MDPAMTAHIEAMKARLSPALRQQLDTQMAAMAPAAAPVAEMTPVLPPDEKGGLWNNLKFGHESLKQMLAGASYMGKNALGMEPSTEDYANTVAKSIERQGNLLPQDDMQRMAELMTSSRTEGQSVAAQTGEFASDLKNNPDLLWKMIAQNYPQLLAIIPSAWGGAALAGAAATKLPQVSQIAARTVGAGAGSGTASGAISAGSFVTDYLSKIGVDLSKPEEIQLALEQPEIYNDMQTRAVKYGIGVGVFDALAGALAGRTLRASGVNVANLAKETGKQAALGMSGEATGQAAANDGAINIPEVLAEGVAEVGTGPVEAIAGKFIKERGIELAPKANNNPDAPPGSDPFETEIEDPDAPSDTPRPTGQKTSKAADRILNEQERKPIVEEEANAETVNPQYPSDIITGTFASRRRKLMGRTKADLVALASKYPDLQIDPTAKKGEMANAILNYFGVTENIGKTDFPPVKPVVDQAPGEKTASVEVPDGYKTSTPTIGKITLKNDTVEVPVAPTAPQPKPVATTLPADLAKAKPMYGKGTQGNFEVNFPSDYEKAMYIVANKNKKSNADQKYRDWLKATFGMGDEDIDATAVPYKKEMRNAPIVNGVLQAPPLTKPEPVMAPTEKVSVPRVATVRLKPVQTNPVQNKKAILATNSIQPGAIADLTAPEAAQMANVEQVAKENGNTEDLIASAQEVYKQLIKDQVESFPKIDFSNWDYKVDPVSQIKKWTSQVTSMMNAARRVPLLAPLWSTHDKVALVRQSIIDRGLHTAQYIEKTFGADRMRKGVQVLIQMQKTDQKIKTDASGRVYYRNADKKLVLLDENTSKALIELQGFFKTQANYYIEEARQRLADIGMPQEATVAELNQYVQELRDSGASEVAITEAENLVELIDLKNRFDADPTKPYVPRYRNTGPFAISYYVRKDASKPPTGDNLELRHFASVASNWDGSKVSQKDFQKVAAQAEKERKSTWKDEEWFTSDGRPASAASPFLLDANNIASKLNPNAFNAELLASLLTMKGVNPAAVQETIEKFTSGKEGAKLAHRFMPTGNYTGYNENPEEIISSFISGTAATFTKFKYGRTLNALSESARRAAANAGQPHAVNLVQQYTDFVTSMAEPGQAIRQFNYIFALGANPSSAILQMASVPQNYVMMMNWAAPSQVLSIRNIGRAISDIGKSMGSITRNYGMLSDPSQKEAFRKITKLKQSDVDFLFNMKKTGALDALLAADFTNKSSVAAAQRQRQSWFAGLPIVSRLTDGVDQSAGHMIAYMESAARTATALITHRSIESPEAWARAQQFAETDPAYRAYMKGIYGGSLTKEQFVELVVKDFHGSFGKENRAAALRGPLAGLIMPLASFMFHYMDSAWNAAKGPEGRKVLVAFALTLIMMGGVKALPGYGSADELWRWLAKKYAGREAMLETDLADAMQDLGMDKTLTSFLLRGAPYAAAGIDVSARIRPTLPGLGKVGDLAIQLAGATNPEDMFGIVGSAVGAGRDMMTAAQEDKPILPAAQAAMPAVVRNLVKGYNIMDNNVKTAAGNRLFDYDAKDASGKPLVSFPGQVKDVIVQAAGFTPSRLAEARMMQFLGGKNEYGPLRTQWTNRLYSSYTQLVDANAAGDKEAVRALAEEIRDTNAEFNKRWEDIVKTEGEIPFDPTTIDQSVLDRMINKDDPFARPAGQNKFANREKIARDMGLQFIPPEVYSNQSAKERLSE